MKKNCVIAFSSLMLSCALYAQNKRMNVVFIMADDLGLNDTGYTGNDFYETPNIDKLSEEGMVFTNAYSSAANSAPSRACFMSGMYTPRHGIFTVSPPDRGDRTKRKLIPIPNVEDLRKDIPTMGELFKRNGYRCGHVGKWHLGDDEDGTGPLSRGFDVNVAGGRAGTPYSYYYPYCNNKGMCHIGLEKGKQGEYLTDRLTDEAVAFIKESAHGEKPFFLYLAHHAVHTPITAPQSIVDKYEKKVKGKYHTNSVYAAMVETLDNSVGKICGIIDSLGISDNTIIIFTSDHGEYMGDYGLLQKGPFMYDNLIKVPLLFWGKGVEKSVTSDEIVENIDIVPTILELIGKEVPYGIQGESLKNILQKIDKERVKKSAIVTYDARDRGIMVKSYRDKRYKLNLFMNEEYGEMYDLEVDPQETTNLFFKEEYLQLKNELLLKACYRMMECSDPLSKRTANW